MFRQPWQKTVLAVTLASFLVPLAKAQAGRSEGLARTLRPAANLAAKPAQKPAAQASKKLVAAASKKKAAAPKADLKGSGASKVNDAGKASTATATGQVKASADKAADAKPGNLPPVLDPSKFFGQAQMGYACAAKIPEICSKLFCYCGCDITDKHCNLLECFASLHGVDCHICQEEAVMALRMSREDQSLAEIQKQIDINFQQNYPFQTETQALKTYKATRLWQPTPDKGSATQAPSPPESTEGPPQVKEGAKVGSCCAAGHKDEKNSGEDSKNKDASKAKNDSKSKDTSKATE